ncbi:long-chain acyl-CoA synthetase [Roseibium hamelinense]|uniref:Long-chain-fatty-acid--CoA ligase n=1 Tax=Roseibium hamelinense TaxID=150831 RepID=A0A562T9K1_9HYPH|nr:AMP-binding protein [Roseibium hamelinense]MTI45396.1 long-chain fatty acid--CoA ligase [Roseibium hamelinense]TWI90232.1 long-chain acyl-CoA synthetase [Roseibium hamelinense]
MTPEDRPWTAFYGPDMRIDIETASYRTIGDLVRSASDTYGKAPAFTACMPNGMNGTLTFEQVDEMSDAFAVYLREVAGLAKGDRVALQMPNGLAFPVAAFGIMKAGCVLVNVNPLYTADEMSRQFADAEPHALVIIDMFADKIPAATRGHPIPNIIVTRIAEFLPTLPRGIIGLVQKYWDRSVKPVEVPHIRFPDALAAGRTHLAQDHVEVDAYTQAVAPSDVACLQYTGGTTGVAKGAMLTHENIIMNMEQSLEMIPAIERGKEVALTALPMYHIFAFTLNLLAFYWLGGRNILIPSPRPLSNLKRAFENYKITWMSGVNTLFNGLNNELWFRDSPPKHLKLASAGGMALQAEVAKRWEEITGKPVLQGYGLTETSPVLSFNPLGKTRDGSIGVPLPSTFMCCVDDNGVPVPQGERGEIAAKGPQIMAGYWNKPEETAKVMKDGWFLTGDIGVMDADGYFSIVDRKKDMVVVSGFNVYPNEIEDCLASHPGIFESAVIGVPNEATGEAVKAFVVLTDKTLTPDQIRAYCKEHLTAYKVPKRVEIREQLPKSNVGKILRKDLRTETQHSQAAE